MRASRRVERAGLWLAVVALHVLLLVALRDAVLPRLRGGVPTDAKPPLLVRLIALPAPLLAVTVPATRVAPARELPARKSAQPEQKLPPLTPGPRTDVADAKPMAATGRPAVAAELALVRTEAPVASAPDVSPTLDLRLRLPRGSAERGGLTLAPDSMVRQALNDPRSNAHSDPRQALPDAVAASAKGDCMKGEYFSPATGLLSIPFLFYAVAAGNCKPQR